MWQGRTSHLRGQGDEALNRKGHLGKASSSPGGFATGESVCPVPVSLSFFLFPP